MRHRVTLQTRDKGRNTAGEVTETWTDQITVYASVEPMRGREFFGAERFANEITTVIKMRYQPRVTEAWRAKRDTPSMGIEVYGILAIVRPYAIKREMWLFCKQMPLGQPV